MPAEPQGKVWHRTSQHLHESSPKPTIASKAQARSTASNNNPRRPWVLKNPGRVSIFLAPRENANRLSERPCTDRSPPLKRIYRAGLASLRQIEDPLFLYLRYTSSAVPHTSIHYTHSTCETTLSFNSTRIHSLLQRSRLTRTSETRHVSSSHAHITRRRLITRSPHPSTSTSSSQNNIYIQNVRHPCSPPHNPRPCARGPLQLLHIHQQRCARSPDGFPG